MANIDKLKNAGLVSAKAKLTEAEVKALNSLSEDEVNALISAKAKLGDAFVKKHLSSATSSDCFL